jgi:(E)-4-hydroxy-3-methylbut-2-enyl-diphosphate synthase
MHNQAPIQRRKSKRIYVGNVPVGDGAPIAVQSMTNTRTTDVEATVNQIKALERVGADIVRVSVPTMDAAEAFKLIKQQVSVPLVADIHFDYRIALKVAEYGVDCLRINPGNIGNEERIARAIEIFLSASALTPVLWKKICRKNTANRHHRRCWNRRCATWIIWIVLTSINSKSA